MILLKRHLYRISTNRSWILARPWLALLMTFFLCSTGTAEGNSSPKVGDSLAEVLKAKTAPHNSDRALFKAQNKVSLLVAFASWCEFCQGEMPKIIKYDEKGKNCGLNVVGIAIEKDQKLSAKAIKDWGIGFPVIQDLDFSLKRSLDIKKIPVLLLVDQDMKVLSVARGVSEAPFLYKRIERELSNSTCGQIF